MSDKDNSMFVLFNSSINNNGMQKLVLVYHDFIDFILKFELIEDINLNLMKVKVRVTILQDLL